MNTGLLTALAQGARGFSHDNIGKTILHYSWRVAKHNSVRFASMVYRDSRRVKPLKPGKAMYETAQQACETHETG